MAKHGNSKAVQSVKIFCANAAAALVQKKKQRKGMPQEALVPPSHRGLATCAVATQQPPLADGETPLGRWMKNRMQQKKNLTAASE